MLRHEVSLFFVYFVLLIHSSLYIQRVAREFKLYHADCRFILKPDISFEDKWLQ